MHVEHTCENCGTLFLARRSDARCCSKRCAKQRLYRIEVDKTCEYCGIAFRTRWKAGRFCSHACGLRGRFKDIPVPSAECLQCGQLFTWTSHRSAPRKFCSNRCRHVATRASAQPVPRCVRCSKPVMSEGTVRGHGLVRRKYCSMNCRRAHAAERGTRTCEKCGKQFRTRIYLAGLTRKRWFCSKTCKYPRSHQKARASLKQSLREHRKRANGGDLSRSEWERVKATYRNRCVYCGARPKRLTIDHVIPVSRGGHNDAANVVPACRSCNSRKGNRAAPTFQPVLLV